MNVGLCFDSCLPTPHNVATELSITHSGFLTTEFSYFSTWSCFASSCMGKHPRVTRRRKNKGRTHSINSTIIIDFDHYPKESYHNGSTSQLMCNKTTCSLSPTYVGGDWTWKLIPHTKKPSRLEDKSSEISDNTNCATGCYYKSHL